jgi:hypothetical protein
MKSKGSSEVDDGSPTFVSKLLAIPGGMYQTGTHSSRSLTFFLELRNRIYDAVLLYDVSSEEQDLPRLRHWPNSTGVTTSPHIEDWSILRRQAYGLTQVSSVVREEVLPLYREKVIVRVDIRDLPHYVTDVILSSQKGVALVHGNISIDVGHDCSVDLQDTILLHSRAPNFHLRFTHPRRQNDMMSILLEAHRWPKFHAYISECTSHVVLDIDISDALVFCPGPVDDQEPDEDWDPPLLIWPYAFDPGYFVYVKGLLYIKEEFTEPWMSKSALPAEHWYEGLAKWEAKLGLGGAMQSRCSFRPQISQGKSQDADFVDVSDVDWL